MCTVVAVRGQWVVSAGAFAFVACALVVPLVLDAFQEPSREMDWSAAIAECANYPGDVSLRGICLEQQWVGAGRSGSLRAFADDLDVAVSALPELEQFCHNSGHAAGRQLLAAEIPVDTLLLSGASRVSACDNGVIHGVLENLHTVGDSDKFDRAVRACQELSSFGERTSVDCGHGLGHGAQRSYSSFDQQYEVCLRFRGDFAKARSGCLHGVLMNHFRDMQDRPIVVPFDDPAAVELVVSACEVVAEVDRALEQDCWFFAAAPFLANAEQSLDSYDGPVDWGRAESSWRSAYQACDQFPVAGHDPCRSSVATQGVAFAHEASGIPGRACSWFPGEALQACRLSEG